MFSELSVLCRKVNEFRDLIFKEFVQNRSFFTTAGTVEKLSVFYIPFKRIAVGIILLVLLLNAVRLHLQQAALQIRHFSGSVLSNVRNSPAVIEKNLFFLHLILEISLIRDYSIYENDFI